MDDFVDSLLPPSASCMLLYPFSNELKKEKKSHSVHSFLFHLKNVHLRLHFFKEADWE